MKVCIQAGHKGTVSGSTGAPGERDWNSTIVPLVAKLLRDKGVEVYETDAAGYNDSKVTSTDWDLFLAVHYDADIYGDRGGFVDYPDPSADMVWEKSKSLSYKIGEHYFKTTGIPERPSRSNANTKFYYMWQYLTPNTPCVLIECGVGWRKPEDYEVLRKDNHNYIAQILADAVLHALGMSEPCDEYIKKISELEEELDDMRESRDKWKQMYKDLEIKYENDIKSLKEQNENLQKTNSELTTQLGLITRQYETLLSEKSALELTVESQKAKIKEVEEQRDDLAQQLSACNAELADTKIKLEEANKKAKARLCSFPYRERVLSLIRCRK